MRGHIRERSPGRWAIVLDVPGPSGKRRRKWHSFKGTKREAQKECARLLTEMNKGSYVDSSKLTVAEHVRERQPDTTADESAGAAAAGAEIRLHEAVERKPGPVRAIRKRRRRCGREHWRRHMRCGVDRDLRRLLAERGVFPEFIAVEFERVMQVVFGM